MKNTTNISNGSTVKWKEGLVKYVETKFNADPDLKAVCTRHGINLNKTGIHLAVFSEPFLSLLLNGKKTIESRFSINRVSPFQKVETGDIVFVKKSGGEIMAFFVVGKTEYYHSPSKSQLTDLKRNYSKGICANSVENFWENKELAKYVSLFEVLQLTKISPKKVEKKDRTAWTVLKSTKNTAKELWEK